ncbi:MAG: type II toxin-antitoxin system RelE/ParE family toxin [Algicola sp.]|nr:type II toxin-antitoxin system RelE/ParE family toxin [Algicola sp.]
MNIKWSNKAIADINLVFETLSLEDSDKALKVLKSLVEAPMQHQQQMRMGERSDDFDDRDVRRMLIGEYEMRYELRNKEPFILRVWHTLEAR